MSCLYILEIKLLLVASFANIFSQSLGYMFVLFMVSFAVQKLVRLIRSHLFLNQNIFRHTSSQKIIFYTHLLRKLVEKILYENERVSKERGTCRIQEMEISTGER